MAQASGPRVRVHNLTMSLDGYVAGPSQTLDQPMGVGGESLHPWMIATRYGATLFGDPTGGSTGVDNDFAQRFGEGVGAFVMGRNMFGPVRGPWPTDPADPLFDWRGWWGQDPPYHCDVFVMTHHPRPVLEMDGGNRFHFVEGSADEVLALAREAAGDRDVQVGGGASTVRQFLAAGLIDELHVAISPTLLGDGERLFEPGVADGYEVVAVIPGEGATHVRLAPR